MTNNLLRRDVVAFWPLVLVLFYWGLKTLNTTLVACAKMLFFPRLDALFVWKYCIPMASVAIHKSTGFTKLRMHKTIGIMQLGFFYVTHLLMLCSVIATFGVTSLCTSCSVLVSWYLCFACMHQFWEIVCCTSLITSNISRCAIQASIRESYMPLSVACCIPAFIQQVYNEYSTN